MLCVTVYEDNYLPVSSMSTAAACGTCLLDIWFQSAHVSITGSNCLCRQIWSIYINSGRLHSC